MRVSLLIRSAVIIASLALVALVVAPSAGAADQPIGSGAPGQKEEMKKDITKEQSEIRREQPATGELGKGSERLMRVPEGAERGDFLYLNPERQTFDPDILEHMRIQDQMSSTSQ